MMDEPAITINNVPLTVGQAMTVRVALGSFAMSLNDDGSLGDDEHGKAMTTAYRARLHEIFKMISR